MDQQQLIRSFYDSLNSRDMNKMLSYFSDDADFKFESTGERFHGKNEIRAMSEDWLRTFPDGKFKVHKFIGSGDDWSVEMSFVGTHQGPLKGPMGDIPASGNKVDVPTCDVITLKNGKIRSLNCYLAGMVLLNQIGAISSRKVA